jgi:hypothetical protein
VAAVAAVGAVSVAIAVFALVVSRLAHKERSNSSDAERLSESEREDKR